MSYPGLADWRTRRNQLNSFKSYPVHFSISRYSTKSLAEGFMQPFGDEIILNSFHMIPDPLKKNLGDSLVSSQINIKGNMKDSQHFTMNSSKQPLEIMDKAENKLPNIIPTFSGITNFFSEVFNILSGSFFQKHTNSCVDEQLNNWHESKSDSKNENLQIHKKLNDLSVESINTEMDDCRVVAEKCEDKINKLRKLISSTKVHKQDLSVVDSPKVKEESSPLEAQVLTGDVDRIHDKSITNITDFISQEGDSLSHLKIHHPDSQDVQETTVAVTTISKAQSNEVMNNETIIPECSHIKSLVNNNCVIDLAQENNSQTINTSTLRIKESTDIVTGYELVDTKVIIDKTIIPRTVGNEQLQNKNCPTDFTTHVACTHEDKFSILDSLLSRGCVRKPNSKNILQSQSKLAAEKNIKLNAQTIPKSVSVQKVYDKRYKNPKRRSGVARAKSHLKKVIEDDISYTHESESDSESSMEISPGLCRVVSENSRKYPSDNSLDESDYFNEVTGCFQSSPRTGEVESFQIVLNDIPIISRSRKPSECESEDSFIVFEESPNSCYTSNDVFEDDFTDLDDSDFEVPSSPCKLPHSLSKSFNDLTDTSLYEDEKCSDEVDCASSTVSKEVPFENFEFPVEEEEGQKLPSSGLLLTPAKKRLRKYQPAKTVRFSSKPPVVHRMIVWAFAARQARAGHWERYAVDRDRFKRRIADVEMAISWVLKPQHRTRVMFQVITPWRNRLERLQNEDEQKAGEINKNVDVENDEAMITKKETVLDASIEVDNSTECDLNISCDKTIV